MTTYTTTYQQLAFALAEALPDFAAVAASGHESYGALADALVSRMTAHAAPSVPDRPMRRVEEHRESVAYAWRAEAQAAGERLGKVFTDAYGRPVGEDPTRVAHAPAPDSGVVGDQIATMLRRYRAS